MQQKRVVGFFSTIKNRGDAQLMIRYVVLGYYLLSGVLVILALFNRSTVWVDALVYAGLAYALGRSHSRAIAIILALLSLGLLATTLVQVPAEAIRGRNPLVAFFMLMSSLRAVEATFKLYGRFSEPQPE
jgi:hypothetical protein